MFPASDWPLHLTVVPPFETTLAPDALSLSFPPAGPITARVGAPESFGARRTVPVLLIEPSAELTALHVALMDALEAAGARFGESRYVRAGYRPHVTVRDPADAPRTGDLIELSELALVDRAPDGRRGLRRVVARIPLR